MCKPESPFYLSINYQPNDNYWYKRQPMGKNKLGTIMNTLSEKANLQGKKTNHSARKTMITLLSKKNVPDTQIQQLSGHKNIQSLNSYKTASLQQQKEMSHIISGNSTKTPTEICPNQVVEVTLELLTCFKGLNSVDVLSI